MDFLDSSRFFGNLGVNLIHPLKFCAGLADTVLLSSAYHLSLTRSSTHFHYVRFADELSYVVYVDFYPLPVILEIIVFVFVIARVLAEAWRIFEIVYSISHI